MSPESIGDFIITDHAVFEMERRNISVEVVKQVLLKPEQRIVLRKDREVFQSRLRVEGSHYLYRVIVDVDRKPMEVVTVYRTSRIEKYWEKIS